MAEGCICVWKTQVVDSKRSGTGVSHGPSSAVVVTPHWRNRTCSKRERVERLLGDSGGMTARLG